MRPTRSSRRSRGKAAGGDPERPGIVHRLDRDTSGLMVVARSDEAYERLTELVRERAIERTYLALVRGRPRSRRGQDRRADRPRPRRPDPDLARQRLAARGRDAFRGGGALSGARAAPGDARDGADAPDPRPSRGDRPAGRRRPDLRRRRSRRSTGSSCTPRSSRSRIRSRASAWRSSPSSRPTSANTSSGRYHRAVPTSLLPGGTPSLDGGRGSQPGFPCEVRRLYRNTNRRKGLSCPSYP